MELLIVVAIIGILAVTMFVIIKPGKKIEEAEDAKVIASLA